MRYERWSKIKSLFYGDESILLMLIAVIIGCGAGFSAIGFRWLIVHSEEFFSPDNISQLLGVSEGYAYYVLPLVPAIAGLIVGFIITFIDPSTKGHGVPEVMNSIITRGGVINRRVAVAKAVASSLTIGSGGSAGSEGPIVQIGASLGSTIGQFLSFNPVRMRILVASGASAGISAMFYAPITGIIFSIELFIPNTDVMLLGPVVISSVIATAISQTLYPQRIIVVPSVSSLSPYELLLFLIFGIIAGIIGLLFHKTLYFFEDLFDRIKIPNYLKPAIGGLSIGIIGVFFPQVIGMGYSALKEALFGHIPIYLLLLFLFLKILTTSLTLGSGGSGGILSPSIYMGGMLGMAYGFFLRDFLHLPIDPSAYGIVGLASVFSGASYIPFTSILLVIELTGDYSLILPIMLSAMTSAFFAKKIEQDSIYTEKLSRRGIVVSKGRDISILQSYSVKAILTKEFVKVRKNTPLFEIIKLFQKCKYDELPVVDNEDRYIGIVSLSRLRQIITDSSLYYLIIAEEVADRYHPTVDFSSTLYDAFNKFTENSINVLPVLREDGKLEGIITYYRLMVFYRKELFIKGVEEG